MDTVQRSNDSFDFPRKDGNDQSAFSFPTEKVSSSEKETLVMVDNKNDESNKEALSSMDTSPTILPNLTLVLPKHTDNNDFSQQDSQELSNGHDDGSINPDSDGFKSNEVHTQQLETDELPDTVPFENSENNEKSPEKILEDTVDTYNQVTQNSVEHEDTANKNSMEKSQEGTTDTPQKKYEAVSSTPIQTSSSRLEKERLDFNDESKVDEIKTADTDFSQSFNFHLSDSQFIDAESEDSKTNGVNENKIVGEPEKTREVPEEISSKDQESKHIVSDHTSELNSSVGIKSIQDGNLIDEKNEMAKTPIKLVDGTAKNESDGKNTSLDSGDENMEVDELDEENINSGKENINSGKESTNSEKETVDKDESVQDELNEKEMGDASMEEEIKNKSSLVDTNIEVEQNLSKEESDVTIAKTEKEEIKTCCTCEEEYESKMKLIKDNLFNATKEINDYINAKAKNIKKLHSCLSLLKEIDSHIGGQAVILNVEKENETDQELVSPNKSAKRKSKEIKSPSESSKRSGSSKGSSTPRNPSPKKNLRKSTSSAKEDIPKRDGVAVFAKWHNSGCYYPGVVEGVTATELKDSGDITVCFYDGLRREMKNINVLPAHVVPSGSSVFNLEDESEMRVIAVDREKESNVKFTLEKDDKSKEVVQMDFIDLGIKKTQMKPILLSLEELNPEAVPKTVHSVSLDNLVSGRRSRSKPSKLEEVVAVKSPKKTPERKETSSTVGKGRNRSESKQTPNTSLSSKTSLKRRASDDSKTPPAKRRAPARKSLKKK